MRPTQRILSATVSLVLLAAVPAPAFGQDETVPPLASSAPTGAPVAASLPALEGVEWLPIGHQRGVELEAEGSASAVAAWRQILDALDATFDDLSVDVHLAAIEGSDELDYGVVLIARIDGADAAGLRAAFEAAMPTAMPPDAVIRPASVAGRDVLLVEVPPDYRFIYHYAGDAAYQLDLAPEIEAAVLAGLP